MKSSAPIAIALTLLMFLLVLTAAFVFVFQGQMALRQDFETAQQEMQSLQQAQAQTEIDLLAAQATQTVMAASFGTVEAASGALQTQYDESQQAQTALADEVSTLESKLVTSEAALAVYESQGPIVNVVSPLENTVVEVDKSVRITVTATDVNGIHALTVQIGDQTFGGVLEEPQQTITLDETWIAVGEGPINFKVIAENVNGVVNDSSAYVVLVVTPTPEPTETSTPTPPAN